MQIMNGSVFLIGAGPGDPGLLTLRGAELLRCADIVLYDGLCNTEILTYAPQASHICVGKHGQSRIWKQSEIIDEIIRHAKKGKRVARLKGGDPAVFARTTEEIDALAAQGIPFEIVPGITAALASGSYAGIPITHRNHSSAVALVTGHEQQEKSESALDWNALARFPGTLVIYMGVTTAPSWTEHLIQGGLPPNTPAALVRRCSLMDQEVIRCTLTEIPKYLSKGSKLRPPVIVIIGQVADLQIHEMQRLANQRPLSGKTILVTRPIDQAEALAMPLRELGATVLTQPLIKISPPRSWDEIDSVIDRSKHVDVLIFCSQNGVRYFMDRLHERNLDVRQLSGIQIAAVGVKTESALRSHGIRVDIVPQVFSTEDLARSLGSSVAGKEVAIVRASRGDQKINDILESAGASVSQIVSYLHQDVSDIDEMILQKAKRGEIDWVTVMSGESARNLRRCFGELPPSTKIASISPMTSKILRELGLPVSAEASPYTTNDLVKAILEAIE